MMAVCVHVLHRARAERRRRPGRPARRLRPPAGSATPPARRWCPGWSATPSARCWARRCWRSCPRPSSSCRRTHVLGTLLAGILLFFVLEKLVLWRHCHTHDCEVHDGVGGAGARRRRVSQLRGRRRDRRGRDDVDSARHQHRGGGGGARDSPGARRLRHPAARGLLAQPGLLLNVLSARRQRGRRGGGVRRPSIVCRGAALFPGARRRQLPLRRDGGSDPGSAPRPHRRQLAAPDRPDRGRHR